MTVEQAIECARWHLRGGASYEEVAAVYGRAVAKAALVFCSPSPVRRSLTGGRR